MPDKYFVHELLTSFLRVDRAIDFDGQDFVLVVAMLAAGLFKYPTPPVGNIQLWMAVDRMIAVLLVLAIWSWRV
jgi:hypothetical protein